MTLSIRNDYIRAILLSTICGTVVVMGILFAFIRGSGRLPSKNISSHNALRFEERLLNSNEKVSSVFLNSTNSLVAVSTRDNLIIEVNTRSPALIERIAQDVIAIRITEKDSSETDYFIGVTRDGLYSFTDAFVQRYSLPNEAASKAWSKEVDYLENEARVGDVLKDIPRVNPVDMKVFSNLSQLKDGLPDPRPPRILRKP